MRKEIIFVIILFLFSTSVFSLSSNTTYSCSNSTTLVKNVLDSNGVYSYSYIPCPDGCSNGYCVDSNPSLKLGLLGVISLIASAFFFYKAIDFFDINSMKLLFFTLSIIMVISAIIESGVIGLNFVSTQTNSELLVGIGTSIVYIFIFIMMYAMIKFIKDFYVNLKAKKRR